MHIKDNEPSIADTLAGIGTALVAAVVMLTAVFVPLLLVMKIIQQGAGLIFASVLVFTGVATAALYWVRHRERRNVR